MRRFVSSILYAVGYREGMMPLAECFSMYQVQKVPSKPKSLVLWDDNDPSESLFEIATCSREEAACIGVSSRKLGVIPSGHP